MFPTIDEHNVGRVARGWRWVSLALILALAAAVFVSW